MAARVVAAASRSAAEPVVVARDPAEGSGRFQGSQGGLVGGGWVGGELQAELAEEAGRLAAAVDAGGREHDPVPGPAGREREASPLGVEEGGRAGHRARVAVEPPGFEQPLRAGRRGQRALEAAGDDHEVELLALGRVDREHGDRVGPGHRRGQPGVAGEVGPLDHVEVGAHAGARPAVDEQAEGARERGQGVELALHVGVGRVGLGAQDQLGEGGSAAPHLPEAGVGVQLRDPPLGPFQQVAQRLHPRHQPRVEDQRRARPRGPLLLPRRRPPRSASPPPRARGRWGRRGRVVERRGRGRGRPGTGPPGGRRGGGRAARPGRGRRGGR